MGGAGLGLGWGDSGPVRGLPFCAPSLLSACFTYTAKCPELTSVDYSVIVTVDSLSTHTEALSVCSTDTFAVYVKLTFQSFFLVFIDFELTFITCVMYVTGAVKKLTFEMGDNVCGKNVKASFYL